MNRTEMLTIIADVTFQDMLFDITYVDRHSWSGPLYLQGAYLEKDTVTGNKEWQYTRKWLLSSEITKSELVQTAFKCAMASMEHRTREWFRYKGRSIFHPHYDIDKLWEIAGG